MPLPRDDTTPPVTKMYFVELTDSPPSVGGSTVFPRTAGRLPCRHRAPRARETARHRSERLQQRPQLLEPLPPLFRHGGEPDPAIQRVPGIGVDAHVLMVVH